MGIKLKYYLSILKEKVSAAAAAAIATGPLINGKSSSLRNITFSPVIHICEIRGNPLKKTGVIYLKCINI